MQSKPGSISSTNHVQGPLELASTRALSIQKPSKLYEVHSLDLLHSHLSNGAKGRNFYSHLLNYCTGNEGSLNPGNNCNLVTRYKQKCSKNGISLYRYVLDDDYRL